MHVTPGHAFEKTVFGQNADVLRKIGVINSARLQIEHLGREQCGETDRSRRADDDFGESLALDVVEHLQNWREAQLLQLVLGQFKFADWFEIFDRDIVNRQFGARGNDDQFLSSGRAGSGHFANGRGHAVDVFERVGEPGALVVLQRFRNFSGQFLENLLQPFA